MSKSSGGTRTISSNNAAQSRTQSSLSGKVSTMDEANKVMDTYKNLYNMPAKEQKAFTDSFGQAVMDTFNDKKKGYDDLMLQRTNKAFKENNKADYELQKEDSLRYFTYEKEVSGKNYFYLSAVAKSNDSFWLLTFASDVKDRDKYEPLFKTWAKSVKFE